MSRVRAPSITPSENGLTDSQTVFPFQEVLVVELVETVPVLDLDRLDHRDWVTIVWNDPVNLMNYVSYVFRSYFGFDSTEAERLMLLVHNEGRAVVATGPREEMERHVEAMHDFGLWATLAKDDA
jgi:ATP-dependent Clp protease adaptor protein ClpS